MSKPSLSVIFITKNEEFHIGNAIDNVKDIAEEIFVVDSGSTDKTVEIAGRKGAKVLFHAFEGFGKQWNWALDNCPVKTVWTMKMDPDERASGELKDEIRGICEEDSETVAYQISWQIYFMGKPVKTRSHYFTRIWKTGCGRFSDVLVNEHFIPNGELGRLSGKLNHFDSKDLTSWLEKQNRYTYQEALMRYRGDQRSARPKLFGNTLERRMFLGTLFYKLPFRYLLIFWYYFLFTGAWRSGVDGWRWAQMRVFVLRVIEYKWIEMIHKEKANAS